MPLPYRRGAERIIKYLTGKYQLGGVLPTNDGYFTGVPKCFHNDRTHTGNVGAGLDLLQTITIPAALLKTDGDYVTGHVYGNGVANDNDKQIHFVVDGNTVIGMGLSDIDGSRGWEIAYRFARVSNLFIVGVVRLSWNELGVDGANTPQTFGSSFMQQTVYFDLNVGDLIANPFNIEVFAQGTANDDVFKRISIAEVVRF